MAGTGSRRFYYFEIVVSDDNHFQTYWFNTGEPTLRRHLPSLDRLRALREVARTGGFSSAADTLGLTQPAVSNQIRQLEQQLGARLLERIGKTARPTAEGAVLIAAADRALATLDAALDDIALMRATVTGTLVLATGATSTRYLLPAVVAELTARHSGIDLRIVTGNTGDLVVGVLDGSIDLGLLTAPVHDPHLDTRPFYRDRLVCVTPPSQAPTTGSVTPRDLEGRRVILYDRAGAIRRSIDTWLDGADRDRIRITDIGSSDAQMAYVRAGFGWSIISEMATREDAAARRVDVRQLDPPIHRDLVLVWRRDRAARPVIEAALAAFAGPAGSRGA